MKIEKDNKRVCKECGEIFLAYGNQRCCNKCRGLKKGLNIDSVLTDHDDSKKSIVFQMLDGTYNHKPSGRNNISVEHWQRFKEKELDYLLSNSSRFVTTVNDFSVMMDNFAEEVTKSIKELNYIRIERANRE